MPDYSQGKIYKIVCEENNNIYIGSTTRELHRRLSRHKSDKRNNNGNCYSRFLDLERSQIILLENYPCESKNQLLKREQYWIDNNDCINKNRSSPLQYDKILEKEKLRKREQRKFKSSWAFNNNVYGFRLCLLDIDITLFQ
tara:strand:- start:432 stop:854 length:423 start_codon:yes stop_codon:yes gene_type:complete